MRTVRKNVYWHLTGKILKTTEKAVFFQLKTIQGVPFKTVTWWPKSQIEDITLGGDGEDDSFDATQRILEQKGFGDDLANITAKPKRTLTEVIEEEDPEPADLPRSERRSYHVRSFDDMDDDIPI